MGGITDIRQEVPFLEYLLFKLIKRSEKERNVGSGGGRERRN